MDKSPAQSYTQRMDAHSFPLLDRMLAHRTPVYFNLEITARCNNDCRHCYINLPAGDQTARAGELTRDEISAIADQAVAEGALWCLITGGEPLLREDFIDIYLDLKKKGLLIVLYTNACLITERHIEIFRQFPPRTIEVTVYGASEEVYERVTRKRGTYAAFRRGLDLLAASGLNIFVKAAIMRSNVEEFDEIVRFCHSHGATRLQYGRLFFRRQDRDGRRDAEILAERLSLEEISELDGREGVGPDGRVAGSESTQGDAEAATVEKEQSASAFDPAQAECAPLPANGAPSASGDPEDVRDLFECGAGVVSFTVGYDGAFRICSTLVGPEYTVSLREKKLSEVLREFVPGIRRMESVDPPLEQDLRRTPLMNYCGWCPAYALGEAPAPDGCTRSASVK
jgi:MoaA/NifB/PqqE/SkfB family radical SAM enzyme